MKTSAEREKSVYLQASLLKFDIFYVVVMSFRRFWIRQPMHRAKLSGSFRTIFQWHISLKTTPDGNVLNLKVLESN